MDSASEIIVCDQSKARRRALQQALCYLVPERCFSLERPTLKRIAALIVRLRGKRLTPSRATVVTHLTSDAPAGATPHAGWVADLRNIGTGRENTPLAARWGGTIAAVATTSAHYHVCTTAFPFDSTRSFVSGYHKVLPGPLRLTNVLQHVIEARAREPLTYQEWMMEFHSSELGILDQLRRITTAPSADHPETAIECATRGLELLSRVSPIYLRSHRQQNRLREARELRAPQTLAAAAAALRIITQVVGESDD